MAIGKAVQYGKQVQVYNDKELRIGMYFGELHGFTSSTVSVKRGDRIYTYNEHGLPISTEPVD
jgi:hypothetical protein